MFGVWFNYEADSPLRLATGTLLSGGYLESGRATILQLSVES